MARYFMYSRKSRMDTDYDEVAAEETLSRRQILERYCADKKLNVVEVLEEAASGFIMRVFQANACKIITPGKAYDLQNESDGQFADMKFMFSRYELKTARCDSQMKSPRTTHLSPPAQTAGGLSGWLDAHR